MRHRVRLDVAVVILAGPDIAAGPFHRRGHHVVDQPMLVGEAQRRELLLKFRVEDLLEQVLEAAVIGFQNRVLGREIDRKFAAQRIIERRMGEVANGIVEIIHRQRDAGAGEGKHFLLDHRAVLALEFDGQPSLAGNLEIRGAIHVAIGVAADHDRRGPSGHETRHVARDDRLAKDHAAQNVADRAIGRFPHLLEAELFYARLVGRDRRAFDADAELLDRVGGVDRHLVGGGVAILDRQIVIFEIDVEIGVDQLFLDIAPDDVGHLVAVELDDRIGNLDFRHCSHP